MQLDIQMSAARFRADFQGRVPLLVRGSTKSADFGWADVDRMVMRADASSKDFKLLREGLISKTEYLEQYVQVGTVRERLSRPSLYRWLREGATLSLNKIAGDDKVLALESQIRQLTGRETLTSCYLSYGTAASFRNHWDTRDLFALQMVGRKRWLLYAPSFRDPLYMQQSRQLEKAYPCGDLPFMDVLLEPGDLLYVPKGWWHDPRPLGDPSFHFTVGAYPPLMYDFLHWLLLQVPQFQEARGTVDSWTTDARPLADRVAEMIMSSEWLEKFEREYAAVQRVEAPLSLERVGEEVDAPLQRDLKLRFNGLNVPMEDGPWIANGAALRVDSVTRGVLLQIASLPDMTVGKLRDGLAPAQAAKLDRGLRSLCEQDVIAIVS